MKTQEYQARELLEAYSIPTSKSKVVFQAGEVRDAFSAVANPSCVMKVQVLMGARGKAGGVKEAKNIDEALAFVEKFLKKPFSTSQSKGQTQIVDCILMAEHVAIAHEYYLSVAIDRQKGRPVILFSREGGVDIEETAKKNRAAIKKIHFLPDSIPSAQVLIEAIEDDFSDATICRQVAESAINLAKLFVEKDASICEINPLVLTPKGEVVALDSKVIFDDNALFRHEVIQKLRNPDEYDARETRAKQFNLSYVSMEGSVGCLVNGAGLAMATMDMIKLAGGEPANFLDVGGGATSQQVCEAFKIILDDKRVKAILVNIFGGIMKCDVIAQGILDALKELKLETPLIVRLEGTRVEEGRALLKKSQLKIISALTIKEAAEKAVHAAKN